MKWSLKSPSRLSVWPAAIGIGRLDNLPSSLRDESSTNWGSFRSSRTARYPTVMTSLVENDTRTAPPVPAQAWPPPTLPVMTPTSTAGRRSGCCGARVD